MAWTRIEDGSSNSRRVCDCLEILKEQKRILGHLLRGKRHTKITDLICKIVFQTIHTNYVQTFEHLI